MTAKVTGVRSIELGVRNLKESVSFYSKAWGLEDVPPRATPSICAAPGPTIIC